MSDTFQEIPNYPYHDYIKTPGGRGGLGMSDKGDLKTLGKDINGLISYVEILVSGDSKASKTGGPLGNRYFLKTPGKCNDIATNKKVDRSIYIDNVPAGNIPFITSGLGVKMSSFKGLIPGTLSNLELFNPRNIIKSLSTGSNPDCQEITLQTIDIKNNKSTESNYVAMVDIEQIDPCNFKDNINPITKKKCNESFTNLNNFQSMLIDLEAQNRDINHQDLPTQVYFASLGLLSVYILYCLIMKKH